MSKKKKILVLNYEFPPLGGGGGVSAKQIAEGFVENGYEVDYLTMGYKNLPKKESLNKLTVHRVWVPGRTEIPTATLLCQILFPIFAFPQALQLTRQNRYEFINTHFAVPTGPLGTWVSKIRNLNNILSIHGGDIYDPTKKLSPHSSYILNRIVRWVMNNAKVIVAQSSNTKNNAEKYYSPNKEIKVIPLPYTKKDFLPKTRQELSLKNSIRYTVSVGRLVKRKGFDDLITAIAKTNDPHIHAIIIGDGPEKNTLYRLSKKLNVQNRIHFYGNVSEEIKFQLMNVSDLYVLSSKHEGFGIVLQEAMQVGLPILATDNGGQIDLVDEGLNGKIIPVSNTDIMAEKIKSMITSKPLRYSSSKYMSKFNSKKIALDYINNIIV
jgi:glycosyltransferase involved in cell wall biosynthesis